MTRAQILGTLELAGELKSVAAEWFRVKSSPARLLRTAASALCWQTHVIRELKRELEHERSKRGHEIA